MTAHCQSLVAALADLPQHARRQHAQPSHRLCCQSCGNNNPSYKSFVHEIVMVATARSRWVAVQESYQAARWRVMALELVERDNIGKWVFHH